MKLNSMIKILLFSVCLGIMSFAIADQIVNNSTRNVNNKKTHEVKNDKASQRFRSDMYQLMTFYSKQTRWWEDRNCILADGCNQHEGIWFWSHAQYLLANYQGLTHDKTFNEKLSASYVDNWDRIWGRRYLDDSLWWALALIRDYEITHDKTALKKAQGLVDFVIKHGRQNICHGDGGIYWDTTKTQVGTIANELLIIATSRLYLITHNSKYKNTANHTWQWFKKSGLINSDYSVTDHYIIAKGACGDKVSWQFSYNSGTLLMALLELHRINNYDKEFLLIGTNVANKAIHDFQMAGVITENCTNVSACADDGFMFKGIYAYDLATFAKGSGDINLIRKVRVLINNSYNTMIHNNQADKSLYPFNWGLSTDFSRSSPLYNPSDVVTYLSGIYLELAYLEIN